MYTFAFVYQTVKLEATSEENVKDMTSHNIPAKASASQKSMRQGLIMLKILMTLPVLFALLRFTGVSGGPLGYGICQSGCQRRVMPLPMGSLVLPRFLGATLRWERAWLVVLQLV
ncbi:uncharacterized protein PHALS_08881 [Plasmopara halstedii]|uniref:Uncharacterized protein n=1 Tax=Plasmopara halstedii TaxID=4781 RepID=A0A0P1AE97_PLAHL|nr:uncharacterized protein PHALS_08881 [Plasmopara halstedii]CEG38830.1 hypothetical protein PHALS_08881 [Plasmopara halstedii]|eukprot:XP_024575199.1 hypothetical protein PHALS_08881 [Plasmopara halstedii]